MNYMTNENGDGILVMTPLEKTLFEEGKTICHLNGDRLGRFTITAKLTRPASRARRFPAGQYGKNYKPEKNPLSASVQLKADREAWMREQADELLGKYDFGSDVVLDTDGWEEDEPDVLECNIFFENQEDPDGDSTQERFRVDFRGKKPVAEVK